MAGGKASARQKMINLMYLVFIAMMAMQMSKEVLSAFGLMNDKFVSANTLATESNSKLIEGLELKAEEKPEDFQVLSGQADQISKISNDFFNYIEAQKDMILEKGEFKAAYIEDGKLPAEEMDKGDFLDEFWFKGDKISEEGKGLTDRITKYKEDIKNILGDDVKYIKAIENLENRFDIGKVENTEGKEQDWLVYNFQGFPSIASYTKLTAMQNDVKATEANMYNLFLGNSLDDAISLNNYKAIVIPEKNAYFAGESFKAKVVIGKYASVKPTKLTLGNTAIDLSKKGVIDSLGSANISFTAGGVGERSLSGEFTFLENKQEIKIPYEGKYVVVPRPNSATISADKMNVVYRGVTNPMTISFAGVPDSNVSASGSGLSKGSGTGKYNMVPTSGKEVTISVSAKLDDGSTVSDKAMFRIKDIPKPTGKMAGVSSGKLPRNNVEIGKVVAELEDFDFDLPLTVTGFKIKVPGQPSVVVSGNRLNGQAKGVLRKAKRGAAVTIFDIKSKSNGPRIKPASPIVIELSN